MATVRNRSLSRPQLDAFGAELDALRARTLASLGQKDADYIRAVVRSVRYTGFAGRALIMLGAIAGAFVPWLFWPALVLGTLALAWSKIVENMEVGHNVIHGQYDWMRDPHLDGKTYDWDIVATAEYWRKTHNFQHHTYTNVRGMDDDIGYGLLRIFPEQKWRPFHLTQPLIAIAFAVLFEWGVALQDVRLGSAFSGRNRVARFFRRFAPVGRKISKQVLKDYVLFPALAGPWFLPVLLANVVANLLRNLWTYVIIFCGHFTADVETFPKEALKNESRGHWYLRQLRGSSNLTGGAWIDFMSGNLSHQIEHHLFPDLPSNRYREIAGPVRELFERHGLAYRSAPLLRQVASAWHKVVRLSAPPRR